MNEIEDQFYKSLTAAKKGYGAKDASGNLLTDIPKAAIRGVAALPETIAQPIQTGLGYGAGAIDYLAGTPEGQVGPAEAGVQRGFGALRDVTTRPLAEKVREFLPYSRGTQEAEQQLSQEIQGITENQNLSTPEKFLQAGKAAITNPRGSFPAVAESIPQFLAGGAALKAAKVAMTPLQQSLLLNAALEGAGGSEGARQGVLTTPVEELRKSPRFAALEQQYGLDNALKIASEEAGSAAYLPAAAGGAAATAVTGGGGEARVLERLFGNTPETIARGFRPAATELAKETGRAIARETPEETLQGVTGQFGQNIGLQPYTGVPLTEGLAEQGAASGVAGGLTGGAYGPIGAAPTIARSNRAEVPTEEPTVTEPTQGTTATETATGQAAPEVRPGALSNAAIAGNVIPGEEVETTAPQPKPTLSAKNGFTYQKQDDGTLEVTKAPASIVEQAKQTNIKPWSQATHVLPDGTFVRQTDKDQFTDANGEIHQKMSGTRTIQQFNDSLEKYRKQEAKAQVKEQAKTKVKEQPETKAAEQPTVTEPTTETRTFTPTHVTQEGEPIEQVGDQYFDADYKTVTEISGLTPIQETTDASKVSGDQGIVPKITPENVGPGDQATRRDDLPGIEEGQKVETPSSGVIGETPEAGVRGKGVAEKSNVAFSDEQAKKVGAEVPSTPETLTDTQKSALDTAQKQYQSQISNAEQTFKVQKDEQLRGKQLKGAAMQYAAEKRKITGQLTEKEEAKAKQWDLKLREGAQLKTADGKIGKVVSKPAYGKFKVQFENETTPTILSNSDKFSITGQTQQNPYRFNAQENVTPQADQKTPGTKPEEQVPSPAPTGTTQVSTEEKVVPTEKVVQPVLAKSGNPFQTEQIAKDALKSKMYAETASTHKVVKVEGGFGLMPRENPIIPKPKKVEKSVKTSKAKAAPKKEEAVAESNVKQLRQGEIGIKLSSNEKVLTSSGRETTPFPNLKWGKTATSKTYNNVERWLLENAALEAESRNDEFNARIFRSDLKDKVIPQASKDSAEEYLFGKQPEVRKNILKPLIQEPKESQGRAQNPYKDQTSFRTALKTALDKKYGKGFTNALLLTGTARIIGKKDVESIVGKAKAPRIQSSVKAFYNPKDQITYFIHDNIDQGVDLTGLVKHEIAVHAMQLGKDTKEFQSILNQFRSLQNKDNAVKQSYDALKGRVSEDLLDEEALGYLLEHSPDHHIVKRFILWLKAQLRKLAQRIPPAHRGVLLQWANELSAADLVEIGRSVLQTAPITKAVATGQVIKPSFAGPKAKTADQYQLQNALDRLDKGEDAEAVRQDTGWFRGPDDKLRFEIDDSTASIKFRDSQGTGEWYTLGDVLDHPRLFSAYPEIADIPTRFMDISDKEFLAYYNPGEGFTIGNSLSNEELLSAVMHEVQHDIQNRENFAEGGNANMFYYPEYQQYLEQGYKHPLAKHLLEQSKQLKQKGKDTDAAQYEEAADSVAANEAYRRLAGERESRNVQKRLKYPAHRRAVVSPIDEQNFDVKPEEVIVLFGNQIAKNAKDIKSYDKEYPIADKLVDGLKVLSEIPNKSSISASLNDYTVLPGIRKISFDSFDQMGELEYYSKSEQERTQKLAKEINNSKEIKPLIVVIDNEGPYILEGGHRFDALRELNINSFPALVVIDNEALTNISKNAPQPSNSNYPRRDIFDDHLRYSLIDDYSVKAQNFLHDFMDNHSVWGKTNIQKFFGTQMRKGEIAPEYGLFWGRSHVMFQDESRAAARPAEEAPDILPNYNWRNFKEAAKTVFTGGRYGHAPAADLKVVMDTLAQATLWGGNGNPLNGKRFTDAELRLGVTNPATGNRIKLNDAQIGLYKQVRAAIDGSLTEMASSEMWRQSNPILKNTLTQEYLNNLRSALAESPHKAKSILSGTFTTIKTQAQTNVRAAKQQIAQGIDKKANQKKIATNAKLIKSINELIPEIEAVDKKSKDLIAKGYMPLMRFGEYVIYMNDPQDPSFKYAARFEGPYDANRARRELVEKFPNMDISEVTRENPDEWKNFKGVSPETQLLFAKKTGIPEDDVLQQFYKEAISNQSALRRMIHREGYAGYSEDLPRVLASFLTSNAKRVSYNYHMADLEAMKANAKGEIQQEMQKLMGHITNEETNSQAYKNLRGFMATWYILGSMAGMAVNMTQPITMSYPRLFQDTNKNTTSAAKLLIEGYKGLFSDKGHSQGLIAALKKGERNGTIDSNEVYHLWQEAIKPLAPKKEGNVAHFSRALQALWGTPYAIAEFMNRKATFIAAYKLAEEKNMSPEEAYQYAEKVVNETQGIYGKHNRANAARTGILSPFMVFKQFSISYLEMLNRMATSGPEGQKAALLALGILVVMGGFGGLPFEEDIEDIIDTVAQAGFGKNFTTRSAIRQALKENLGQTAADLITNGATTQLPIDLSGRYSMSNMLPLTAAAKPSEPDVRKELAGFLGAPGSFITSMFDATRAVLEGEGTRAAKLALPRAVGDYIKGIEMAYTGKSTDYYGNKIADASFTDALLQTQGFNPQSKASIQRDIYPTNELLRYRNSVESRLADRLAKAILNRDDSERKGVLDELKKWNQANRNWRIEITPQQIQTRLRSLSSDKVKNIIKRAPREVRQTIARSLLGTT